MSWPQWSGVNASQPPVVAAAAAPILNPAPNVMPPSLPYGTDQWAQMQQQNWQQWAQWQQQYQQWHQQYGAEYHKSMNALAAQQTTVPNLGVPPPLPVETQPPLPKDESPKPPPLPTGLSSAPPQPPMPQYSTQAPPPRNQFSAPPPNFPSTVPPTDWRANDNTGDQKRPLVQAEESATKRQMLNRQGWKAPSTTPQNWQPPVAPPSEELSEAEKKFDKQFAEWEAQFNKWKEQNSGHPDKQQYREYEKKWEQWRQQLLDRREAMRKKRLGIVTPSKVPPNQNFSVPPPTQVSGVLNTPAPLPPLTTTVPPPKCPPLPNTNMSGVKDGLMPTALSFNKPPPDMNDEPLQFKKSELESDAPEGDLGFLSSSKSEGIPGLDLVRDGDTDPNNKEEEEEEQLPQKGPDLEAISKGINNILGDQKLMNMLSIVSQNQNMNQSTNVNTTSKISDALPQYDQSNLSTEDSRNEPLALSEGVQNFDDQTRSSFTMPNEGDFYRAPPPNSQFNRGTQGYFDNEPPLQRFDEKSFGVPPPTDRFRRATDFPVDTYSQNRGLITPRNSGDFERNTLSSRDNLYPRGPGSLLGPGKREGMGSLGLGNRDSFGLSGMSKGLLAPPDSFNRNRFGPGALESLNRENLGSVMNKESFGAPGRAPATREKFGLEMKRDDFPFQGERSDNFAGLGGPNTTDRNFYGSTSRGPMNRDNFESDLLKSENDRGGSQIDRGNLEANRSSFGTRSFVDNFSARDAPIFGNRTNYMGRDLSLNNDGFNSRTLGSQNFEGRRDDFDRPSQHFEQMPPNLRTNERDMIQPRQNNFNQRNDLDRFDSRLDDAPPFSRGLQLGRFERDRDNLPPNRFSLRSDNAREFKGERGMQFRDNFRSDRDNDYPPPPSLIGKHDNTENRLGSRPRIDSFGNSQSDVPEPPVFNREVECDLNYTQDIARDAKVTGTDPPVEDIWKPTTVIDYDHKSLKPTEMDILVEPFRMFDYRHKALRRIPFPERPNWLSDSVRMIPEFDPPIIRPPVVDRRKYDDRYEPLPRRDDRYDSSRRDDRYDISRKDDRHRYERGGYEMRFSPPSSRRDDNADTWSGRRNRSRSPSRFERHPVGGDRFDKRRNLSRDREWESKDDRWRNRKNWEDDRKEMERREDSPEQIRDSRQKDEHWDNKNKSDWEERARQWEEDDMDVDEKDRSKEKDYMYRNRSKERDPFNKKPTGSIFPMPKPQLQANQNNVTPIEEILNSPGRFDRPPRIVIILRGPPGSGKTFLAKIIKDKEVENGGSAPRILSLDDYFMIEQEKEVKEDGKMIKIKDMVYEFEAEMEESYRASLMRSFKKTITDGYFPFIIVDNVNDRVKHFGEMWSFAKQNGFQVYICQLDLDVQLCTKRNIHNRSEDDIRKCVDGWENTPSHHPILDASSLLQDEPIREVEMEEISSPNSQSNDKGEGLEDQLDRSKWDNFDCSINNLARLDGVHKPLRPSRTMEEYLQLDDEWTPSKSSRPGQKRVRWADLEERKQQEKMRAIGFVVGQTDWERMMDPSMGETALTQTKYIEKVARRRF